MTKEIEEYRENVMRQSRVASETGIHDKRPGDPTARAAVRLADPPEHIKSYMAWVDAINDAMLELHYIDQVEQRERGMEYVALRLFGMDGRSRRRIFQLTSSVNISESAISKWVRQISEIVIFHAAKRGLI